jgi:hypothetical protein
MDARRVEAEYLSLGRADLKIIVPSGRPVSLKREFHFNTELMSTVGRTFSTQSAKSRQSSVQQRAAYSITSLASASSAVGANGGVGRNR